MITQRAEAVGAIATRIGISDRVKEHFCDRACSCLFLLEKQFSRFQQAVHIRGRGVGKANNSRRNELLRDLFDVNGNLVYERGCVLVLFGVSPGRLDRVHKQARVQDRLRLVPKEKLSTHDLNYIDIPPEAKNTAVAWFDRLKQHDLVSLRVPVGHGLLGRPGNRRKTALTLTQFLEFVKANSYPNGRREGSGHAQYFFSAHFTSIGASRAESPTPGAKSLHEAFNDAQRTQDGSILGETTFKHWLETLAKGYALRPHATDYCDRCTELKLACTSAEATLRRFKSAATTAQSDLDHAAAVLTRARGLLESHQAEAAREREVYKGVEAAAREAWRTVPVSPAERSKLVAVVTIDFMQELLLPHFGFSPQPGKTYYLMKLNVHLWGAVFLHAIPGVEGVAPGRAEKDLSIFFATDERADGAKTSDHLITYLNKVLAILPAWCVRLHVYGDNAATIKSKFLVAWAANSLVSGRLVDLKMSFMIPGHTKFAPDRLFSSVSRVVYKRDLFTVADVVAGAGSVSSVAAEVGSDEMHDWRTAISEMYSSIPGIRELRYFHLYKDAGTIVMKVAKSAAPEAVQAASIKRFKRQGDPNPGEQLAPAIKKHRGLDPRKHADLRESYNAYVARESHPVWLATEHAPTAGAPETNVEDE